MMWLSGICFKISRGGKVRRKWVGPKWNGIVHEGCLMKLGKWRFPIPTIVSTSVACVISITQSFFKHVKLKNWISQTENVQTTIPSLVCHIFRNRFISIKAIKKKAINSNLHGTWIVLIITCIKKVVFTL